WQGCAKAYFITAGRHFQRKFVKFSDVFRLSQNPANAVAFLHGHDIIEARRLRAPNAKKEKPDMKLKVLKKQNNSAMCVVCGLKNDLSLRTRFYAVEGDLMVGVVAGRDEHQSYPNRMHGGLITALLDE